MMCLAFLGFISYYFHRPLVTFSPKQVDTDCRTNSEEFMFARRGPLTHVYDQIWRKLENVITLDTSGSMGHLALDTA